jgi:hypothetical protein
MSSLSRSRRSSLLARGPLDAGSRRVPLLLPACRCRLTRSSSRSSPASATTTSNTGRNRPRSRLRQRHLRHPRHRQASRCITTCQPKRCCRRRIHDRSITSSSSSNNLLRARVRNRRLREDRMHPSSNSSRMGSRINTERRNNSKRRTPTSVDRSRPRQIIRISSRIRPHVSCSNLHRFHRRSAHPVLQASLPLQPTVRARPGVLACSTFVLGR